MRSKNRDKTKMNTEKVQISQCDKKSQTKNKRASGEKIKNVKEKTPPSQKKESASRLGKHDIKVNMICLG
ncbi:hypothetical protein EK904_011052 [Melospiza melodia maxima]|nr:hypothetical protein EK904_011052 [Melospiza melodia maxima]